jgi:hypothetical protein
MTTDPDRQHIEIPDNADVQPGDEPQPLSRRSDGAQDDLEEGDDDGRSERPDRDR